MLIARDRADEAREWLDAAARTNPRSVEAAFLSAYLRWEDGDRKAAAAWLERAALAAHVEPPPKGVLGEGDRRAPSTGPVLTAAPPLRDPMGRTLFSDLAKPVREMEAKAVLVRSEELYSAVREARRSLALQVRLSHVAVSR